VTHSRPLQSAVTAQGRLDLHNASIDASAAAAGQCGMTDLHTGRVCQVPAHHVGGCDFVAVPAPPGPSGA
jgi:hypothetical protein